jgi:subtilisin family serine protease
VINLSLGSTTDDPTVESLISQAESDGIIVVAAAGNCGGSSYTLNGCNTEGQMLYPAAGGNVIAVGATDLSDVQASFSSRGPLLDVTAPGSGAIISSEYLPTNSISAYSSTLYGTSFATPIVSGLMAILRASWPNATFKQLRAVLIDSALKTKGMNGSLSTDAYGFGRIQPTLSQTLANKCKDVSLSADINCDGSVGLLDLSLLASQWEKQYTGRTDINFSGLVDLLDLSTLASQWGK